MRIGISGVSGGCAIDPAHVFDKGRWSRRKTGARIWVLTKLFPDALRAAISHAKPP
jgi:hypothetical protein